MTPREVFDPRRCSNEQQRALIVHAVLYGGPLLVLDSDFINNLNFRDSIVRGDRFFIPMIEHGLIRFAIRERNGQSIPLGEIAEGILRRKGHTKHIPVERFGNSEEFEYIQEHAQVVPYSEDGAGTRYHRETIRILETTQFTENELPPKVHSAVLATVREYAEGNQLNWSYFMQGSPFWTELEARLPGSRVRERFGEFMFAVARGPYVTFIPDALGVNPTYSREDQLGIDLWRGRHGMPEQVLERKQLKRSRIGIGDYVQGLAALSIGDIERVRNSGEWAAYEAGCQQLARGTAFPSEPLGALHHYRRRVDDAVLEALSRRRDGNEVDEEYEVSGVGEKVFSEVGKWCRFAIKEVVAHATFGLPHVLEFGHQRLQAMLGQDEVSEAVRAEREKEVRKEIELTKLQGRPLVDSEITADKPSVRDIFTSLAERKGP